VPLHFTPNYHERIVLRDGLNVELRLIRPDDRELLLRGFHELSSTSRYLRFLVPKLSLSGSELRYLTEVDHLRHVAIGVVSVPSSADEEPHGLGIARLIALADKPGYAEAAIAVLDARQGQGIGSLLFTRLLEAARERQITHVCCEVLAHNAAMISLISQSAPSYAVDVGGGVMTIVFPIDAPADTLKPTEPDEAQTSTAPPEKSALQTFFSLVARATVLLGLRSDEPQKP
jgi:GNAT superfamily N-acetyltransferase